MPRAGLTRLVVAVAAADLADESGWHELTLAAVAQRLGVRQPSLYKHVESAAALRREVSVLAVADLARVLTAAVAGRSGVDALQSLADAYRRYAHRHPGRYAAGVVAPSAGDAEHVRLAEEIITALGAVLHGYRIDGDDALHAIRALRALLHGFVALEAAGGFALALDLDESYRRVIAGFDAALREQAPRKQEADARRSGTGSRRSGTGSRR